MSAALPDIMLPDLFNRAPELPFEPPSFARRRSCRRMVAKISIHRCAFVLALQHRPAGEQSVCLHQRRAAFRSLQSAIGSSPDGWSCSASGRAWVNWMRIDWLTPTSARAALMLWRSRRTFRVLDCRKPIAGHNRQARTPDKPHEIFSGHIRIGSQADCQQSHRSPRL